MKIWVGEEREGRNIGVKTMFVQEQRLTKKRLDTIARLAQESNIKRIYFGAGKKDIKHINRKWRERVKDVECICETTPRNLSALCRKEAFKEIIIRIDLPEGTNFRVKTDNNKEVVIYYKGVTNSLNNVKDRLYQDTDKVIYNE